MSSSRLNNTPPMVALYISNNDFNRDLIHVDTSGREDGRRATEPCIVLILYGDFFNCEVPGAEDVATKDEKLNSGLPVDVVVAVVVSFRVVCDSLGGDSAREIFADCCTCADVNPFSSIAEPLAFSSASFLLPSLFALFLPLPLPLLVPFTMGEVETTSSRCFRFFSFFCFFFSDDNEGLFVFTVLSRSMISDCLFTFLFRLQNEVHCFCLIHTPT